MQFHYPPFYSIHDLPCTFLFTPLSWCNFNVLSNIFLYNFLISSWAYRYHVLFYINEYEFVSITSCTILQERCFSNALFFYLFHITFRKKKNNTRDWAKLNDAGNVQKQFLLKQKKGSRTRTHLKAQSVPKTLLRRSEGDPKAFQRLRRYDNMARQRGEGVPNRRSSR